MRLLVLRGREKGSKAYPTHLSQAMTLWNKQLYEGEKKKKELHSCGSPRSRKSWGQLHVEHRGQTDIQVGRRNMREAEVLAVLEDR